MDREEYINKMEEKLSDATTYKPLEDDPTFVIREKLKNKLQEIHNKGHIDDNIYKSPYPNKTQIPRMHGQPKIHKDDYPLREIVDSEGSVYKDTDKHISRIIKPYAEKNKYCIKNSEDFVQRVKDLHVEEDEIMVSFDVVALYPSIPQNEATAIIKQHLEEDNNLHERTKMTPTEIIELYEICVNNTYFVFNMKLYSQVEGLAIGAATSGFSADIFMERIETNALSSLTRPPKIWCRFVDDTFSILLKAIYQALFDALNIQHHRIKVTSEIQKDNKLSFLEVLSHIQTDKSLKFTVYRKPTHTDQYLHFNSNHHMSQKLGIPTTLNRRADKIVSDESEQIKEKEHVKRALKRCGYPAWSIDRKKKERTVEQLREDGAFESSLGYAPIPYVKHLSEKLGKVFKKHNITTIYKPSRTLKSVLCNKIKDKVPDMDKTGVIYHIECLKHPRTDYTGETGGSTKIRGYQHHLFPHDVAVTSQAIAKNLPLPPPDPSTQSRYALRQKDPVNYKKLNDGTSKRHFLTQGNTAFSPHMLEEHDEGDVRISVIGQEKNWWRRGVKEALHINRIQPTENKKAEDGEGDRFKLANIYQAEEFRSTLFKNHR